MILLDTNILGRLTDSSDPQHQLTASAVQHLHVSGRKLCIVPQNIFEFWVVATRPKIANGLEMDVAQAMSEVGTFKKVFRLLEDLPTLYSEWENLVAAHSILGKKAHDARLVAAMNLYGINRLLTFNQPDFLRFSNIVVLSPKDVLPTKTP